MDSQEEAPAATIGDDQQDREILQISLRSVLQQHRRECQANGNFLQAQKLHQRFLDLQSDMRLKAQTALQDKQASELQELESTFNQDFRVFNEQWDQKMNQYKQTCQSNQADLQQKHQEELQKTQKNLEQTIPVIPKHSSEFLNLKRIQDTLVRKKEYREAHQIQQKMKWLQEDEKANWGSTRQSKIQMSMNALVKRLDNEMNSFKQKSLNGLEEMKKKRAAEMETFIKKYQNIKKELEISHKVQRNKFEGKHTTGCGIFKTDPSLPSKLISSSPRLAMKDN